MKKKSSPNSSNQLNLQMAEIIVENQICETCGADVRPQALFCYNCGGAVGVQIEKTENKTESKNGNNKSGDVLLKNNFKEEIKEETAEKPANSESNGDVRKIEVTAETIKKDKKADVFEEAKLKSAASLRRKAKSIQPKEIEIIWEEPEKISGLWLTLIVLLLSAFAAAVVFLAISLK